MLHFENKIEDSRTTPITPGEYEVILNTEWKETKQTKQKYINCAFTIRKDVKQEFGGRMVFDGIYKSKQTGDFQQSKINGLLYAIPNPRLDFETYDELIQYLNDTPMIISVELEPADPNVEGSKDRNVVKYLSYKPTVAGKESGSAYLDRTAEKVDPDDLPF